MIQKAIEAISKAEIDQLIKNGESENKTLDYKQELPGATDEQKREFLADVSSFANASGGDIIFGIKEAKDEHGKNTGQPEIVVPMSGINADEAKLRLEEIIRSGISPRIRVQIRQIDGYGDGNNFVLIVRVPKSVASPHVVSYKGSFKFFSRNSAGKYPLDVHELRSAFLATESQAERIKRFREDRLGKIVADEIPVRLSSQQRLVLHLVPLIRILI